MAQDKKAIRLFYAVEDYFPPWRVDLVELFARELPKHGLLVEWSFPRQTPGRYMRTVFEAQVAHVASGFGRSNVVTKLMSLAAARWGDVGLFLSWLKGPRFDVIQVRDRRYFLALLAWVAARTKRGRFIYWLSYPFPENWAEKAGFRAGMPRWAALARGAISRWYVYQFLMFRADHVFVQSDQMREDIAARFGVPRAKMTPVPMGVSRAMLEGAREYPQRATPGKVVYMGTLVRVRRLSTLVEAFAQVRKRVPHATLVVVGEGDVESDRTDLEDLARRLGVEESAKFTGFLPMEQALRIAADAEVCVSPFYPTFVLRSTSPTKLIEYMALGKAVVANDHPDQSRVIADSGAGICVPWSADAFADAITHLLEHPDEAREMGARGPAWVVRHRSYEAIAAPVMARYRDVVAGFSSNRTP